MKAAHKVKIKYCPNKASWRWEVKFPKAVHKGRTTSQEAAIQASVDIITASLLGYSGARQYGQIIAPERSMASA